MAREEDLRRVLDCGIVAVVRSTESAPLVDVCRALVDGGIDVAEITFTVPDALDVLKATRKALGDRILLVRELFSTPKQPGPHFWQVLSISYLQPSI